jgi:hypothetical protein
MSSRNDVGFEIGIPNIRMNITDTNRSIAEQFNEAFNRGDLDAAASCFSEGTAEIMAER